MSGFLSSEQLETFLTPLSEDSPAGEYLKTNRQLYRPLRNAYNIAQTSLQKLSLNPDPDELDDLVAANRENWEQLERMLLDTLEHHSRDLECMVWLAMAELFSEHPYARLAGVINFIQSAIETYWPQIQPWLPDDKVRSNDIEGVARERAELQMRPLKLLFGESEDSCQMAVPIRMLPLVGDIDYIHYQREEAKRAELKQEVRANFASQQTRTVDRVNGIQDALDALDNLDNRLKEQFASLGLTAPGSRFLRNQLEANLQALKDLTDGMIVPWPPDVRRSQVTNQSKTEEQNSSDEKEQQSGEETDSHLASPEAEIAAAHQSNDQLSFDRDQAFHQLRMLSDYFQRTEPQSPVSYLLEKAIRWGYTPLPELMHELLQGNEQTLNRITDLTGMNMTDKTPIPGQPANNLMVVPTVEQTSVVPQIMVPPSPVVEVPEQPASAPFDFPAMSEAPVEDASSAAPGGLAISNLDDLV